MHSVQKNENPTRLQKRETREMALPSGRPPDKHRYRHAQPPSTTPSHKPTSVYEIPAYKKSDKSPICPIQETANHLKALLPEKEKNDPRQQSRSCYLPEQWAKMEKKRKMKRYKEEKRNNPNISHPQRGNRSVPAKSGINKEKNKRNFNHRNNNQNFNLRRNRCPPWLLG